MDTSALAADDHTSPAACGRRDVHDLWFSPDGGSDASGSRPAVEPARSGTYSTNLYAQFLVDRIRGHAKSKGTAHPLFVYAAFRRSF